MQDWTDSKAIKKAVLQKWEKGYLLRHALMQDDLFPMRIKLAGPTGEEISQHFSELISWNNQLKQQSKNVVGYGYLLVEKEFHHRICGKNTIPTHAYIPTLSDGVRLIGKQADLALFMRNAEILLGEWGELREWAAKNPFQVISIGQNCDAILKVLRWFSQHEKRDLYLRQLDITGVDTKFIENNKSLLMQLLDIILPAEQINQNTSNFEKRYGLKSKPCLVRFRILDNAVAQNGCTDISVPWDEFAQLQLPVRRCFITENEVNFLSFPPMPNACVIFGKGYAINQLQDVVWLQKKEIYYWGDIDTHGFNILSILRSFLPQTQSFLMTQETLLNYRSQWVLEEKPFMVPIENLTPQEFDLACNLQTNFWGKGVRLEQERIGFLEVKSFLKVLAEADDIGQTDRRPNTKLCNY